MADVSNLKNDKLWNVERANLRVIEIGHKNWDDWLYQSANMRIGKISSSVEYRMDEHFRNCQFLERNFDFRNWKNCRNLLIFQFRHFQTFWIRKIPKISNLENYENSQIKKKLISTKANLKKFTIWKNQNSINFLLDNLS